MKSFQVIALTLSMLMIISMVKGRRLDLETYSTSLISVGVHNISNDNPPNLRLETLNSSTLYAKQGCESLYGFLPCADTMPEVVFLMFMYMYLMMLGEEWNHKGSEVLHKWIGNKALGASIFRVLTALPRIVVILVVIRVRSWKHLQQENLRTRFFYHVKRLAKDRDLVDEQGNFDFTCFERAFDEADNDGDKRISHEELEHLVKIMFELEKDNIPKEYAKNEILIHFDKNKSGKISWEEFQQGCTNWLEKWKNEATSSESALQNIWNQVKKITINKQRTNLTKIEKIMPRILKQALEKHKLLKEDGSLDTVKLEGLFSQHIKNNNDEISRDELKQFIKALDFGIALDHDDVLDKLIKEFDVNENKTVDKKEIVKGFEKWIDKAKNHDISIKGTKEAIAKFEEDSWEEIDALLKREKPKATIVYGIFGIAIIITITSAFITSVRQFSTLAHIPFLFTAFVIVPISLNAKKVTDALLDAQPHVPKNASETFSEIYNGLVMNNLLGLLTLLAVVYIKGLSWTYSSEVLAIMIPCAIVGLFAFKRDNYPLWASLSAIALYPVSVCIYYVCKH